MIGLIENKPDIDPEEGDIVDALQGDIQLKDVEFTYQMRPDQKVLKNLNLCIFFKFFFFAFLLFCFFAFLFFCIRLDNHKPFQLAEFVH